MHLNSTFKTLDSINCTLILRSIQCSLADCPLSLLQYNPSYTSSARTPLHIIWSNHFCQHLTVPFYAFFWFHLQLLRMSSNQGETCFCWIPYRMTMPTVPSVHQVCTTMHTKRLVELALKCPSWRSTTLEKIFTLESLTAILDYSKIPLTFE